MNNYLILSTISCALACASAAADWYEATGQAIIEHGNTPQARQHAIEDAVKRAALVAGARISSSQQVLNGILQNEQVGISSQGEIKRLQLMSENQNGNMLTVTVRADIEAEVSNCQGNSYRKPVLLSQIQLLSRQDASYGQLFTLGADTTTQLERHLRDYAPAALISPMTYSVEPQQLVYPDTDRLFSSGNQYMLLARINDLSLGQTTSRFWQAEQKERFFALDVSLYDLFEQHLVYQQEYRTSAIWRYNSKTTLLTHGQAFWQLPYGKKIDQLLQAVAEDIQRQLQCQPLLSSIRRVENNQVMLELGKKHGLNTGDELQLFQLQRHPTSPGIKRVMQDPLSLIITDLTEQHAWASTSNAKLLQHIQQGDIVSVRKNSRF
jgi:hypothetical protein